METRRKVHEASETSHVIQVSWQAGSSFCMGTGSTYLAAKRRKNRARKGRESEQQGPDSQLQSASSSPAWQADMHSKGCNGQPCASGVCILNLEGKKGEPRRSCERRLDKKQQKTQ